MAAIIGYSNGAYGTKKLIIDAYTVKIWALSGLK